MIPTSQPPQGSSMVHVEGGVEMPAGMSTSIEHAAPRVAERATVQGHAEQAVLSSERLLGCIFTFLASGRIGACAVVRLLCRLSLVCGKWRAVSSWDGWWWGVADVVLPAGRGRVLRPRAAVVDRGRFLWAEAHGWAGTSWACGLWLHFEIFDERDGLQLLSLRGPLCYTSLPADFDWDEEWDMHMSGFYDLRIVPGGECGRAKAFTPAGRHGIGSSPGPLQPKLVHYFSNRAYEDIPGLSQWLCARVTVADECSGRTVMLWKGMQLMECGEAYQPEAGERGLPAGTFQVHLRSDGWRLMCPSSQLILQPSVHFFVSPEPGQQHLPHEQQLFRIVTGDAAHGKSGPAFGLSYPETLDLEEAVAEGENRVARMIRSMLAH